MKDLRGSSRQRATDPKELVAAASQLSRASRTWPGVVTLPLARASLRRSNLSATGNRVLGDPGVQRPRGPNRIIQLERCYAPEELRARANS